MKNLLFTQLALLVFMSFLVNDIAAFGNKIETMKDAIKIANIKCPIVICS